MRKGAGTGKRLMGFFLAGLAAAVFSSEPMRLAMNLPGNVRLSVGESARIDCGLPFTIVAHGDVQALASGDQTLTTSATLQACASGGVELTFNLLGLLPIKKVAVQVEEPLTLVPGGQPLGVAIQTRGVLVVGLSDLSGEHGKSPGQIAGLRAGDLLLSVGGERVESAAQLSRLAADSDGAPMRVSYQRDGVARETTVTPKREATDGQHRLGLWVRDSTAGVGTLSFYSPEDGTFGALGHAIADGDTGLILPVRKGDILMARIVDIVKGQRGEPGELRGTFLTEQSVLGSILGNSELGLYGVMNEPPNQSLYPDGLPIGLRDSVHTGPATILTTLDDGGVRAYDVEITAVRKQDMPTARGMTVRVTDPALLEKTGGIVQGMSGSPIVQDGRLIGAVTHVFVSDPTQGYGLYIEWMLHEARAALDEAA